MLSNKSKKYFDAELEARRIGRVDSQSFYGFHCEIRLNAKVALTGNVENFSAIGICVELSVSDIRKLAQNAINVIKIFYGNQIVAEIVEPLLVHIDETTGRLGLSFLNPQGRRGFRKKNRLRVNPHLQPIILVKDPFRVGESLHLVVHDLNNDGLLASMSLSNSHILPGMKLLGAQIVLPALKVHETDLVIRSVRIESNRLMVGLQALTQDKELSTAFTQYALFGSLHIDNDAVKVIEGLRSAELNSRKLSKGVRIKSVSNAKDYETVLQLRFKAYKHASKVKENATAQDMSDEFDSRSIILIASAGGVAFASVRLTICTLPNDRFQFEESFPFPPDLLREKTFEVSRLAVLPEFQGGDLVIPLFRRVAEEGLKQRPNLLMTSTKKLRPIYFRLGAIKLSGEVPHPTLEDESLALLKIPLQRSIHGEASATTWHLVYKDVSRKLAHFGFIRNATINPRIILKTFLEMVFFCVGRLIKKKFRKR